MSLTVVSGFHSALGPSLRGRQIRALGYLPLAHIYGLVYELSSQYWGAVIGYARFRTLTDTSVRNCKGDLREFKPQLFPAYVSFHQSLTKSVPAVWELIRKGVESKIVESSPVKRALFWGCTWIKDKMLSYGIPGTSVFDVLAFNSVKEVIGGHVLWSISGGSSISQSTQRFVCSTICPMAPGYGLTETSAYALSL